MIERVVMIKLTDELATPEGRAGVASESVPMLQAVPGVVEVFAGTAAPGTEASWDVCLKVRFASFDDVEPYRVHPVHLAYRDWLAPKMTFLKAWNFEV